MKKILSLVILAASFLITSSQAATIGTVDVDKISSNYAKVKVVSDEIEDKYNELQRYTLDKEREYKKLSTPLERKNFEDATARELQKKQDALLKLKEKKEQEIEATIKAAIKQVAINNQIETILDSNVVYFGGIDVTDKVIKQLNSSK